MTDTLQSAVRYPENEKTKPNRDGLGSASGYVDFVESLSKDNDSNKKSKKIN